MRLVVTADDLGLSRAVTRGVLPEAHRLKFYQDLAARSENFTHADREIVQIASSVLPR